MTWRLSPVALATAAILLTGAASAQPSALTPAVVDRMMRAEWKKAKVAPAPPVDDARFLRRVTLDITGTIPTPEAVTAFLADRSPGKRAKAVEALLDGPRYAAHWTNYWDDVLMGRQVRAQVVDRVAFREWLREQFATNAPWDRFVYDLLTATGRNSPGGGYGRAIGLTMPLDAATSAGEDGAKVNGAVNWLLKYAQTPADLSGTASKVFLGVQIQCAQCHDHKTEKWTQEDFRRFTACFTQARPVPVDAGKVRGIRRVDVRDANRPLVRRRAGGSEYARAVPSALDGTDFSAAPNRRQALATWITARQNPWFAQAIVNRMWAYFMGRGFVDPVDDFRASNPPVMPGLLRRLADDFAAHGYDLKRLIRLICATQAYQLSPAPAGRADPENRLWARYRLKPLEPEVLFAALAQATDMQDAAARSGGRRIPALLTRRMERQFAFLFDVDEEFEQKEYEGTIPQALLLLNGGLTNRAVTPLPGTALAKVLAMPGGDPEKVTALYMRALSRKPTAAELKRWTAFVAGPDPSQSYEDLFWALLNSSEFVFNH